MSKSIIAQPPRATRQVAVASGATNQNLGKIKIPLDKGSLVAEHVVFVDITQTFATTAPNASDVRDAFSLIELISDRFGTLVSVPFAQYYDAMRFTENVSAPEITYGVAGGAAATAAFQFDIHHALDGAQLDILTALQTEEHGSVYVQLTCALDAANVFKGGVGGAVATYNITVQEESFPDYSGREISAGGLYYGFAHQTFKSLDEGLGGAASKELQPLLSTGGKLRFLFLHTYDLTGALPVLSNAILDQVSDLEIRGTNFHKNVSAKSIRARNAANRGFNQAGVYVIEFGDDHRGWPDLTGLNEVRLKYKTKAGAPANWKVQVMQNSIIDLHRGLGLDRAEQAVNHGRHGKGRNR